MSTTAISRKQRSSEQRDKDIATISTLYLLGYDLSQIVLNLNAEKRLIKVNFANVMKDLQYIRAQWQETKLLAISEHKAVELAKLDNLEHQYWLHYDDGKDIKALAGVAHCIQQRSQITGLYTAQIAQNNVQVVFAWGGDKAQIPQKDDPGQTIAGTFARVDEEETPSE